MTAPPNPVESWPVWALLLALLAAIAVTLGGGKWIPKSDEDLRRDPGIVKLEAERSSTLEWVRDPHVAGKIVEAYHDHQWEVTRGILIDTFVFVPGYAALLAIACFWAVRGLTGLHSTLGLAFGWGGIVAGALDWIENAGILVQVQYGWTFAAPLTNAVCLGKWTLGIASAFFAGATFVWRALP